MTNTLSGLTSAPPSSGVLAQDKAEDIALKHIGSWLPPNDLKPPDTCPRQLRSEDLGVANSDSTHHHSEPRIGAPVLINNSGHGSSPQQSPGRDASVVHPRQEGSATCDDVSEPENSIATVASSSEHRASSMEVEQGSPDRRSISPL